MKALEYIQMCYHTPASELTDAHPYVQMHLHSERHIQTCSKLKKKPNKQKTTHPDRVS